MGKMNRRTRSREVGNGALFGRWVSVDHLVLEGQDPNDDERSVCGVRDGFDDTAEVDGDGSFKNPLCRRCERSAKRDHRERK